MSDYDTTPVKLCDGYEAYAQYWPQISQAAHPGAACAVLHLHGIQSHCGWYTDTARALNAAGFTVLQIDRRGCGRNNSQRGDAENADQLIDDTREAVSALRERSGLDSVHVVGVSWGGKLAAAVHARHPDLFSSLVLVTPGLFPIISVSNAEKFRIGWSMVSAPRAHFDIPLNEAELFTDDPKWMAFFREDPLMLRQATAGFFLASRRMDRIVNSITRARPVPLHLLLAGHERIIDNARTEQWARQLEWDGTQVTHYPDSRHTFEFGPDRDAYIEALITWLKQDHPSSRAS